jgi:hypothetical protein
MAKQNPYYADGPKAKRAEPEYPNWARNLESVFRRYKVPVFVHVKTGMRYVAKPYNHLAHKGKLHVMSLDTKTEGYFVAENVLRMFKVVEAS